jgi:glycosyltransferase involved in cell wall biosynthesis
MSTAPRPVLAYVVSTLNPGGTEKLVVEMSLAFAEDHDVFVVCLDEPGLWARDLRARGIEVHCLWRQPGIDLSIPRRLAALLRRRRADIVHAHQCTPWFYSALARLFYPAPRLLMQEHGRFYPEVDNRPRRLVNRLLINRLTHRFVAVSRDIRARLQRYEAIPAERIEVVYNGLKPPPRLSDEHRRALRKELGLPADAFVVGTVGRFDPIKNLPMLVDAIVQVAAARADTIHGLLVGDGPVRPEIEARVRARGMADRIHLTGFRDDARQVVQCMDVFVLASFSEGTSMALLEAMACGVPAVVTDVGGNPEVVVAGRTGWVVPSGATDRLAAALLEAAADPARRAELAQAGCERFENCFSFEGMIDRYRAEYRHLLSGHAGAHWQNALGTGGGT